MEIRIGHLFQVVGHISDDLDCSLCFFTINYINMNKIKIFIDTSVIGGCFDDEFSNYSNQLFDCFNEDKFLPVVSNAVIDELDKAPDIVKGHLKTLKNLIILEITDEILELARKYLNEKIVTEKYIDDAIHIATATINKIDVLVSWNFRHIVNLKKIHLFNSINIKEDYNILEIRSPMELLNE